MEKIKDLLKTPEDEQRKGLLETNKEEEKQQQQQQQQQEGSKAEEKQQELKTPEKEKHHEKHDHEKKKDDSTPKTLRQLFTNITIEYISNVDTKSETFDTRFFFRFEWTPLSKERKAYEESLKADNPDNDMSEEDQERKLRKHFLCPEFRYPTAKEFEIIKDDRIKFDAKKNSMKGGYLIKATILEQLELRNFPLDVQHFSIIIECVNTIDQFEFAPRTTVKSPKVASPPTSPSEPKSPLDHKPSFEKLPSLDRKPSLENKNSTEERKTPQNKFLRLRSENVILSDFHLKHILAEITQSSENQAAHESRKHTILFVSVVMERVAEAYLYRLALFLLILTGSALSTWSVESLDNRLNMLFTLLLTIVALQMVVNSTVPNIPYLTLLDKYTIFTVFFIFTLILETSVIGIEKNVNGTVDNVFFFLFLAFFLGFHAWFIRYCYEKKTKEENIKYTQCRHERDDYYSEDEHLRAYEEYCVDAERAPVPCKTKTGESFGKKYYDTTLNPDSTEIQTPHLHSPPAFATLTSTASTTALLSPSNQ